jgi:hypothetical protein
MQRKDDTAIASTSSSSGPISLLEMTRDTQWADWWLQRKTGSLGVSTGYPLPDKPHFSCSAVLSLSGFYFRPDSIATAQQQRQLGDEKEEVAAAVSASSAFQSGTNRYQDEPVAGESSEESDPEESASVLARDEANIPRSSNGGGDGVKKTTANA